MGKKRLTDLPDELFYSQILTRLPLKDAICFSGVSRKWCRSWTRLPHLKFSNEFFDSIRASASNGKFLSILPSNMDTSIVNKIILMHSATLESFELHNCESFESSIHKWLLWISSSSVKCINLKSCDNVTDVSESLFLCVTLSSLSLTNIRVTKIPAPFKGFPRLVTCHLEEAFLSEKAFEAILLSCPLIENLTLSKCSLPSKLRILSSSLKSLAVLPLGDEICSMEAICPRLESIQILTEYCQWVKVVNLCLPVCVHLGTGFGLLEHFVTVKSLRKITFLDNFFSTDLGLLQSFPCLEELCVNSAYFADYPGVAEFTLRLPNLKVFTMNVGLFDTEAVLLCSWLLKGAPHLETVTIGGISMNNQSERLAHNGVDRALQIANDFLCLARAFPKTKISLSRSTFKSK